MVGRDYIHIVDLAQGPLSTPDYTFENTCIEAVNVETGENYSMLDVVHAFENASGVEFLYEIIERRSLDIAIGYATRTKAQEVL